VLYFYNYYILSKISHHSHHIKCIVVGKGFLWGMGGKISFVIAGGVDATLVKSKFIDYKSHDEARQGAAFQGLLKRYFGK
jgi:hypothetical protein